MKTNFDPGFKDLAGMNVTINDREYMVVGCTLEKGLSLMGEGSFKMCVKRGRYIPMLHYYEMLNGFIGALREGKAAEYYNSVDQDGDGARPAELHCPYEV